MDLVVQRLLFDVGQKKRRPADHSLVKDLVAREPLVPRFDRRNSGNDVG